jgi:hypothetical protein
LCKLHVVEMVQDPGSVFNTGGTQNGGEGGQMRYIYSNSWDFLVQLVLLVNEHKMAQLSSCRTTRNLMNGKP